MWVSSRTSQPHSSSTTQTHPTPSTFITFSDANTHNNSTASTPSFSRNSPRNQLQARTKSKLQLSDQTSTRGPVFFSLDSLDSLEISVEEDGKSGYEDGSFETSEAYLQTTPLMGFQCDEIVSAAQLDAIVDSEISTGVVLRPGFIYGKRKVDGFEIALDLIGEPLERFLRAIENFTRPLSSLPASDLLLAPTISVDDVYAIRDDDFFGIFTIEQIKLAAANVKV
ncbi:hypothetical protein Drorol1_Dr00006929 [Drosera rotundifolia]